MEKLGESISAGRGVETRRENGDAPVDADDAAVDVEGEEGGREWFSGVGGRSVGQVVLKEIVRV